MVFNKLKIFNTFSSRSEDTSFSSTSNDFTRLQTMRNKNLVVVEDEVETGDGRYIGQLASGIPHGEGVYEYKNGIKYQGSFHLGKRDGFGSMSVTDENGRDVWRATGSWASDFPNQMSQWVLVYQDSSTYVGTITVRSDPSNVASPTSSVRTFTLKELLKHGNGEFHTKNEKYFGSFEMDQKSGFGVWVLEERSKYSRYEGNWKLDKFDGYGTFTHADGTVFQGQFKAGVRCGSGALFFPNGDCLAGDWKDNEQIVNSKYKKGECIDRMLTTLYRSQNEISNIIPRKKYDGYLMQNNEGKIGANSLKWNLYKVDNVIAYNAEKQDVARFCTKELTNINAESTTIEPFLKQIRGMLQGQNTSHRFFNSVIKVFLSTFEGCISKNTTKRWQKTEFYFALEDVRSVTSFLCDEIWEMFQASVARPSGMDERTFIRTLRFLHRQSNLVIAEHIQDLLANLSTSLFDHYKSYFKDKDMLLAQKLQALKNCAPDAFQVKSDFVPHASILTNCSAASNLQQQLQQHVQQPYGECIKAFEQLNEAKSVNKKIQVMSQLREQVFLQMALYRHWNRLTRKGIAIQESNLELPTDDGSIFDALGAEDCAPILYYILIQSGISSHNAQIGFMYDWRLIDEDNPVITLLTFYDSFCADVLRMDPSMKTSDGVVISCPLVVSSLRKGIKFCGAMQNISHRQWIPSLLIYLSTVVDGKRPGDRVILGDSLGADARQIIVTNLDNVNKILNYVGNDQPKPILGCKIVTSDSSATTTTTDATDTPQTAATESNGTCAEYWIELRNVFPASLYSETAFLFVNGVDEDDDYF